MQLKSYITSVCRSAELPEEEVLSSSRRAELFKVRRVIAYVLVERYNHNPKEVAEALNRSTGDINKYITRVNDDVSIGYKDIERAIEDYQRLYDGVNYISINLTNLADGDLIVLRDIALRTNTTTIPQITQEINSRL